MTGRSPSITKNFGDWLSVNDLHGQVVKETNSWPEAYNKWLRLVSHCDWKLRFQISKTGFDYYQIIESESDHSVFGSTNFNEVARKAYELNYSEYCQDMRHRSAENTSIQANNSYNDKHTKESDHRENSSSDQLGITNSLQKIKTLLLEKANGRMYLTSRVLFETPGVIELPINEYEQLCQELVLSGIVVFDSEEQAIAWQKKKESGNNDVLLKHGKSFKKVFEEACLIDLSLKGLMKEIVMFNRLSRSAVRFYQGKAEKEDPDACSKLFYHYVGTAVKAAIDFYEKNTFSSLELCDFVQEALLVLHTTISEIHITGRKIFQNNLGLRFYNTFTRISLSDLNCRIPVHAFDRTKLLSEKICRSPKTCATHKRVAKVAKEMKISLQLAHQILLAYAFPISIEQILSQKDFELDINTMLPVIEHDYDQTIVQESIRSILDSLPKREKTIIEKRFGIMNCKTKKASHAYAKTLEEVGLEVGVTRERIRQIEQKAIRKLRHPSRSRLLKDLYLYS